MRYHCILLQLYDHSTLLHSIPTRRSSDLDIIKTRVTRMIEQELRDDPYAQEAFSKLLRQAIEEAEKLFDHPLKQYMLFREFEEQVQDRRLNDIPDAFAGNRHAQARSEEHTSELQSRGQLVCRLLL